MTEVLSQDEIDQLLTAISSGEVEPQEVQQATDQKKIKIYDFKRPDKFSKDQMRTISMMHETFSRLTTTALSAQLRSLVQVHVQDLLASRDTQSGGALQHVERFMAFDGGARSALHQAVFNAVLRKKLLRAFAALSARPVVSPIDSPFLLIAYTLPLKSICLRILHMVAPRLKGELDAPTTATECGLKNFSISHTSRFR